MAVTIDGVEVPERAIEEEMARLRPEYGEYVRTQGGEPSETQLREWAVEDLIEDFLFRREAAGQPAPSDERVRQELEQHAKDYADVPDAERPGRAREALQRRRLTREIRKGVKPPDESVLRAYYDANPGRFMVPEALRLAHVCRIVGGVSRADAFLELVRIKAAVEQGRLSWLDAVMGSDTAERDEGVFATVSRGELPEKLEQALFALKPGDLSDVADLGGGTLHLFKVLERLEAGKMPFDFAKEPLADALFGQACEDAFNERLDALKAAAVIVRG
jgi:parvulin-like peptidyl-prolyl isomerase